MKLRLLSAALFLLASCAPWHPFGSTYEPRAGSDYDRDLYECERQGTFAGAEERQRAFDDCMRNRGYVPRKQR